MLQFYMSFVDWFIASFLYCFPYSYRSSNYCDSDGCHSFTLLKALAKSNGNLFAIAFKSEKDRQLTRYWINEWLDSTIIISYFGDSNNIFVNCRSYNLYLPICCARIFLICGIVCSSVRNMKCKLDPCEWRNTLLQNSLNI